MDKFEASNGATVNETPYPGFKMLTVKTPDNTITLAGVHVDALREFFQHERDEELGRWRWPDNPDYVVKHDPLGVRLAHVLHEPSFAARVVRPSDEMVGLGSTRDVEFLCAARAYFEAHPERKPWHDAKPWETWVFTVDGKEQSATLDEDREFRDRSSFTCSWMHVKDDRISAGRRIWPESD